MSLSFGDLPIEVQVAIREVVVYAFRDELEDARENGVDGHIFRHLVTLDNFSEGTDISPEKHIGEEEDDEELEDPLTKE